MARASYSASRRAPSSRRRTPGGRSGLLLGVIVLVAVALYGLFGADGVPNLPGTGGVQSAVPSVSPESGAEAPPVTADDTPTALELLATIATKGKAPRSGYDRTEKFGSAWIDVDGNGCDTRNDILARDLTQIVRAANCDVLTGVIHDPYTGQLISFVRGNTSSALVQIDHVVALSNAWQTGAQQLSTGERVAFANDPLNLLAVDGASNSQKGDGDTATWLPEDTSYRCEYVARQISVKAEYELWVTVAEREAMSRVLSRCPEQASLGG